MRIVFDVQLTLASAYLGEGSNVSELTEVLGSLISAQVARKVVGENAEEASSDYFRLSTGVYDTATVGGVQVTPSKVDLRETYRETCRPRTRVLPINNIYIYMCVWTLEVKQ